MSIRVVSTVSNICRNISLNGSNGNEKPWAVNPSSGTIAVGAPVGINGTNLAKDVTTIQDALNRVSPSEGGASPSLVTDGVCGQKTKNAIQQFQLKQFGWSGADGKINPGGQTITRLNEILGGTNRPAATSGGTTPVDDEKANEIFKTAMTAGLLKAKKWIQAAQANLDIAIIYVDKPDMPNQIPSFGRAERMRLANRYFKIDEVNINQRRFILQRIRYVYATMLQIFARPGGLWGERAFEIDSSGEAFKKDSHVTAHTDYGGYFKGGVPNQFQKHLRADSIFFVRENMAFFAPINNAAGTIVHELSHFCGDVRMGWRIEDFDAYGEPEIASVAKLPLIQRIRHADTYTRFARAAAI